MRVFLTVVAFALVPAAAWAGLGLPNELADPGFESGGVWTISNPPVSDHIPYSMLAPYGVVPAPAGGSFCGGVAVNSGSSPGGELFQVVDESLFPGWDPDLNRKLVEVDFWYYQVSLADVPMTLNVYLGYMSDLSYPDPGSLLYVKQLIRTHTNTSTGGWQFSSTEVELPLQPQWLALHLEFAYFTGTGLNIVDNVDLQGLCIPEATAGAWRSVRSHTNQGDRGIELDAAATGGAAVVSEPRQGGIRRIEVDFNADISGLLIGTAEAEDLTHGGMIPASSQSTINAGMTLVLEFDPGLLPNQACYKIDLAGVVAGLGGDTDCLVRGLEGDTNSDGSTNSIDKSMVSASNGVPFSDATVHMDVNTDGSINSIDKSMVSSLNGTAAPCP